MDNLEKPNTQVTTQPIKVFSVPFAYSMYGRIDVEAENETNAIKKAPKELEKMETDLEGM